MRFVERVRRTLSNFAFLDICLGVVVSWRFLGEAAEQRLGLLGSFVS